MVFDIPLGDDLDSWARLTEIGIWY